MMGYKKTENFKFVQNKKCEYFPCHKNLNDKDFNCLFCFCPLYMLGDKCGGNYIVNNGIKDCSNCTIPHSKVGYDFIMERMDKVIKKASDF